jgi:predicted permease
MLMNIAGLVGALLPVFFVLALGYFAGKRNAFDAHQSEGLSKLALTFALPASLFVSMTQMRKDLLLQQGPLVLALLLSHVGLFVIAWLILRVVPLFRGTPAIIYALMLATSATPVFGITVLGPVLGPSSTATVGLVALTINFTIPIAVVLLEIDAARKNKQVATNPHKPSPLVTGLNAGVKSPLLWAPILGIIVTLVGLHLPATVASCFELIGSTTGGVAVFAVGLVLASHPVRISRSVIIGSIARVSVQSALLFALLYLLHVVSPLLAKLWYVAVSLWLPWLCYSQRATKPSNLKPLRCFSSRPWLWHLRYPRCSG